MSSSKGRSLLGSALKTSSSNNNPASSATAAASTSGTTQQKHVEWDEENLRVHELNVLRGEYGTMRIEEPKTPFVAPASPAASEDGFETLYLSSRGAESGGGASSSAASRSLALGDVGGEAAEGQEHQTKVPTKALTLDDIVVPQDISLDASSMPKTRFMQHAGAGADLQWAPGSKRVEAEHLEQRDPEEAKKQKLFEEKRRMHYNMRAALQRSRQMIEDEEDDEEMEE